MKNIRTKNDIRSSRPIRKSGREVARALAVEQLRRITGGTEHHDNWRENQ